MKRCVLPFDPALKRLDPDGEEGLGMAYPPGLRVGGIRDEHEATIRVAGLRFVLGNR
jgi:hypothetical protein